MKLLFLLALCFQFANAQDNIRHFIYFGNEREKINDSLFLHSKNVAGAQLRYSWRMLEPAKGKYDFSAIEEDLGFLKKYGKALFIQLNDATFDSNRISIPGYLLDDPIYNGGASSQYVFSDEAELHAVKAGWVARRWDPAVRERFHAFLKELGKKFDGRIAGINLPETAVDFGKGPYHPSGFTFENYRDGIIANMKALKAAFPNTVCIQYANFMPGGFMPGGNPEYLSSVFEFAKKNKVGVGGPDILVYKRGQMNNSYSLIRATAGIVPAGVAVQDGNYAHINPKTGKQVTVEEIYLFAKNYLRLDYIFWCIEEPYYSRDVIPFLNKKLQ